MAGPRDGTPSPEPGRPPQVPYLATDLKPGVTVASVCEAMWDAESEFGLLDWEVNGVTPWQAVRFAVFQSLTSSLRLLEKTPDEIPTGLWGRLGYHARLLQGALARNPFFGPEHYDALVFEGARTAPVGAGSGCVYTHDLASDLSEQGKRVQLLDSHLKARHSKSPDERRRFLDAVGLESGLRVRLSSWRPAASDLAFLGEFEGHLAKELSIPVDLRWLLAPGVMRFKAAYVVLRRLLEKRKPSEVYCVCAHVNLAPLVAAARHLGIRVTEVQHAVISRHHIGYSYPGRSRSNQPEYFPDRLLAWEGDWNQLAEIPCQIERVPPHWQRLTTAHKGAAKQEDLMVVLSQPTIAHRLAQALLERGAKLQRFKIVVKLHPAELRNPALRGVFAALHSSGHVRISDGDDLYDLLSRAKYQVGVYSTALYEGIGLGCQTLLVPLPGIEHMAHLLASRSAQLLDEFLARE